MGRLPLNTENSRRCRLPIELFKVITQDNSTIAQEVHPLRHRVHVLFDKELELRYR